MKTRRYDAQHVIHLSISFVGQEEALCAVALRAAALPQFVIVLAQSPPCVGSHV